MCRTSETELEKLKRGTVREELEDAGRQGVDLIARNDRKRKMMRGADKENRSRAERRIEEESQVP